MEQATPEFIPPDQTTPILAGGIHYLWYCQLQFWHVYQLCVQNVDELMKRLLVVGMACDIVDSAVIFNLGIPSFNTVVHNSRAVGRS